VFTASPSYVLAAADEDEDDEVLLGVGVDVEVPEAPSVPELEPEDPEEVELPDGVVAWGVEDVGLGEVAWAMTGAAAAALRLEVEVW
jgi:hypothetical protein